MRSAIADFFAHLAAWLRGYQWGHDEFLEGYDMGYRQAINERMTTAPGD